MERIGRYEIQSEIGQGGFGLVYRAWDPLMHRKVAIKLLTAVSDSNMLSRFRHEADTTGNLRHKNIITVFDYDEHESQPYFVMELVEGRSLKDIIEKGPALELFEAVSILMQVAQGLQYAHEARVIHRDIKPSNIMLLADSSVKILDFGIARFMDQGRTHQTATGMLIGTPEYMAPDQFHGYKADVLTDIFSYGVTSYELLSGKQPFRADQFETVVYLITTSDPMPLPTLIPRCPEALDATVRMAMAKDRAQRYQSMQDLLLDLAPLELNLRRSKADSLSLEARSLVEAGYGAARTRLRRALELDPTNAAGQEFRNRIKRHSKQMVYEVTKQVREEVSSIHFDEAAKLVAGALERYPDEAALGALSTEVEAAREEHAARVQEKQREHEAMILRVVQGVRKKISAERFDEAAKLVAGALERYPDEAALGTLSTEVEAAREEHVARVQEKQREHEEMILRVVQGVREQISVGRSDVAVMLVAGALESYPNEAALKALSTEVEAAREEHAARLREWK